MSKKYKLVRRTPKKKDIKNITFIFLCVVSTGPLFLFLLALVFGWGMNPTPVASTPTPPYEIPWASCFGTLFMILMMLYLLGLWRRARRGDLDYLLDDDAK